MPGARPNYGYSETSPPICFDHTLLVGAAGSDYGVRGFFMAYTERSDAGLAEPVLDDPAGAAGLARRGRIVGGGADWTPSTVDPTTDTVYFDTGPAAPLYSRSCGRATTRAPTR